MHRAVHLEGPRCDGQAYGGCQAACLIYWKEAWLKKVSGPGSMEVGTSGQQSGERVTQAAGCTEEDVWAGTKAPGAKEGKDIAYVCQATQVPAATEPLEWWDIRQYIEDLTSGNVGVGRVMSGFIYMGYRRLIQSRRLGLSRPLLWLYEAFQRISHGVPYPRKSGKIPPGTKTPSADLNLQPGEWVRVKSYDEILATLDSNNKNRGLQFDAEMVPYCGHSFQVRQRVRKILEEKTGKMTEMKNPCIMLEGVVCQSRYSNCRLFCPRSIYSYWREVWLERLPNGDPNDARQMVAKAAK
jgi:hypothetical protein